MAQPIQSPEPIILAREPSFMLGGMEVRPATRQIVRDGNSETLEPRVMQVLVALARAEGNILTRDDLIASCWDGRIVGENAINRVISRVRHVASTLGADSFQLETITKVGYRIVVDGEPATAPPVPAEPRGKKRAGVDRRLVLGGATAIAAGAAVAYFWPDPTGGSAPSETALALYRRGVEAQRQGLADQNVQAGAYFRQAVEADPDYADAWGALALNYRHLLEAGSKTDPETLAAWSRSAAKRALALDPANADAQVALILIKPWYRNWAAIEADCRRLLPRFPDHWLLRGNLGRVLCETGRWDEGVQPFVEATTRDPFLPIGRFFLARALWSAGRLQEAENAIDRALARWPEHPAIWFIRFDFLAYTGRPGAAIAFADDMEARPFGIPESAFSTRILSARAIESGAPEDADAAVTAHLNAIAGGTSYAGSAIPLCAALGRADTAFALLDGYYFNRGPLAGQSPAPIGPLTRRYTEFLFGPPAAPLRTDRRFAALTREIGLDDYWRATGSLPDYRR